ncbi:MAG: hypothetical protein ACKOZY_02970 [Flavobacteriales bacterium]
MICSLYAICQVLWTLQFVGEQPMDARHVTSDELGNVYYVYDRYIERHSTSGKPLFRTSEFELGEVTSFDVTNPMKPFIFVQGTGKLVFFDNTLSRQSDEVDLFAKGYQQVECVAGSRGDAYWLWDAYQMELIKVDGRFQKQSSSGNLAVLLGKELHPIQVLERDQSVYVLDPQVGVLVFDIYGTYRTTRALNGGRAMEVSNEWLYVMSSNAVDRISADGFQWDTQRLHDTEYVDFTVVHDGIFLVTRNRWEHWK